MQHSQSFSSKFPDFSISQFCTASNSIPVHLLSFTLIYSQIVSKNTFSTAATGTARHWQGRHDKTTSCIVYCVLCVVCRVVCSVSQNAPVSPTLHTAQPQIICVSSKKDLRTR